MYFSVDFVFHTHQPLTVMVAGYNACFVCFIWICKSKSLLDWTMNVDFLLHAQTEVLSIIYYCGGYLSGSVHSTMIVAITPNHPWWIASIGLCYSWEGFSTMENILWLPVEMGLYWMRNKAMELSWPMRLEGTVVGSGHGVPLLLFFFRLLYVPNPHKMNQNPSGIFPNHCLTTAYVEETPFKQKRDEEEESHSPLWESCKLCFPEALGIPHKSWNLRAWKTGCVPWERLKTTLFDH